MNAASQDQVPQQTSHDTQHEQTLPTIGEFLAALGATPVVVHPEYPGVPVVLLDIPGDWHEVAREVLPNAFGAWALPAEAGSVAEEAGWVENAVLMVWRLSRPVEPRAVMRCAYTDSRRLADWVELGGDGEDYDGFPSAEISGTYSYAGLSLWMSTRYLIASTPTGQYLLQLTVTTFADEFDEGAFIAESFTVQVPPARPGPGAHDRYPEPHTGSQLLLPAAGSPGHAADSGFRSGVYEPEAESRWRQADSGDSARSFVPEAPAPQAHSDLWPDSSEQPIESSVVSIDSGSYGPASEPTGSWDDTAVPGSDSVIRGFEPPYTESGDPFASDPLTGRGPAIRPFDSPDREARVLHSDFDIPVAQPDSTGTGSYAGYEYDSGPDVARSRPRPNAPGTGSHSVVREFDSVVFEQEPDGAGFDDRNYETLVGQRDSRFSEPADPDSYATIMGIAPPPADTGDHETPNREPDSPSTGNMDFRI